MKIFSIYSIKLFFTLFVVLMISNVQAQKLHVDYIQKEGTLNKFVVEVWISSLEEESMSLSALNTVFDYQQDLNEGDRLAFVLSPKFRNLVEPMYGILTKQNKLRSTMVPVKNSLAAIKVSRKPELFGTLTVTTTSFISYPKVITPSTKGNPTVQAIVYMGKSINSLALTLVSNSISTDENPLVLRLMPNKIGISQTWDEVDIYPNPTINSLTIDIKNIIDEQKTIVNLLDIQGRVVLYGDYSGQQNIKLDVSNISAGIYYISVQNGENIFREKVIKIE